MGNVFMQPGSDVATKLPVLCGRHKTVVLALQPFPLRKIRKGGGVGGREGGREGGWEWVEE